MSTLYWIAGIGVVSMVAEKFIKQWGDENKAQFINIATNVIIMGLVVKMIYSLFNETITMFGLK